ncbi:uncharacterized protein LOC126320578 [Schistocerca gregaria]|uniref:uncharacterized protein LOC126320578 n=1 Tax=Schistocerca gregaria TaxID=7010 RepID=UPI00211DE177|nr:uncharacterized protein LOC126320578 [Schistocerca gregaria]
MDDEIVTGELLSMFPSRLMLDHSPDELSTRSPSASSKEYLLSHSLEEQLNIFVHCHPILPVKAEQVVFSPPRIGIDNSQSASCTEKLNEDMDFFDPTQIEDHNVYTLWENGSFISTQSSGSDPLMGEIVHMVERMELDEKKEDSNHMPYIT